MEKRKLLAIILSVAVVFIIALVFGGAFFLGNRYESLAEKATDRDIRLEYLIKSDFLRPSNKKKFAIASIYIGSNSPLKAKEVLRGIRGEEGAFYLKGILAEIGGPKTEIARVSEIKDAKLQKDLQRYTDFLSGEEVGVENLGESDYDAVIRYFLDGTMPSKKETYSFLYFLITDSIDREDLNKTEEKILLATRLLPYQPYLSVGITEELRRIAGDNREVVLLEIEAYQKLRAPKNEEEALERGLSIFPEDKIFLDKAISFYRRQNDSVKVEYYVSRLELLNKLK